MPETNETPTWAGLFGAAPGIDLTGEGRFIARTKAEALRDARRRIGAIGPPLSSDATPRDGRPLRRRCPMNGHRPHRFPDSARDIDWLLAWTCAACGTSVSEYACADGCPVDWRHGDPDGDA